MSVIFCVISSYFEEDIILTAHRYLRGDIDVYMWSFPCTNWATILRCAVPSLASFPGLSWEWGYTLFWYDYCMRPCNTVRCWLWNACAYNSWQQGNMRLTADVRLTKNSCLIYGCENSGGSFHCFRYMTHSTWQFRGCFGTSSGTEGPSLVQAFSSFFILLDTFCSTHSD